MTRSLSLAHLTFLDLSPPELIDLAAEAGFDAVGLRLIAVNATSPGYPLMNDPQMMNDTVSAIQETGVSVNDIEFVRLTPEFSPKTLAAFLESGARLGAKYIVTAPYDPDLGRLTDNLAAFAECANPYNLSPVLEFFPWTSVSNLSSALNIVQNTGCDTIGVLLDTLHFDRSDSALQDIEDADASRFPFIHLCDAVKRPSYSEKELLHTAREDRLIPGAGDIPLENILSRCPWDVPVALEIPLSNRPSTLDDLKLARQMVEATRALLARLDQK